MKKKKFLSVILIASSAFLATGYSWWTDGLQVKGVVSTGEFKVVGVPDTLSDYTFNAIGKGDLQNIKSFSWDMGDLYPGRTYPFGAEFKNEGSIPAVIGRIVIEPHTIMDEGIQKHITLKGTVKIIDASGTSMPGEISINTTIKDLQDELQTKLKDQILEVGQSLVFQEWEITLPKATCDENGNKSRLDNQYEKKYDNQYEGKDASFDLKISCKQHNQQ